jgi:hypothetical protein
MWLWKSVFEFLRNYNLDQDKTFFFSPPTASTCSSRAPRPRAGGYFAFSFQQKGFVGGH